MAEDRSSWPDWRLAEQAEATYMTGFGAPAKHAAGTLLEALRRSGIERGLVVDLGCGSGILARKQQAAQHLA